jgi:hypothetical protein
LLSASQYSPRSDGTREREVTVHHDRLEHGDHLLEKLFAALLAVMDEK